MDCQSLPKSTLFYDLFLIHFLTHKPLVFFVHEPKFTKLSVRWQFHFFRKQQARKFLSSFFSEAISVYHSLSHLHDIAGHRDSLNYFSCRCRWHGVRYNSIRLAWMWSPLCRELKIEKLTRLQSSRPLTMHFPQRKTNFLFRIHDLFTVYADKWSQKREQMVPQSVLSFNLDWLFASLFVSFK